MHHFAISVWSALLCPEYGSDNWKEAKLLSTKFKLIESSITVIIIKHCRLACDFTSVIETMYWKCLYLNLDEEHVEDLTTPQMMSLICSRSSCAFNRCSQGRRLHSYRILHTRSSAAEFISEPLRSWYRPPPSSLIKVMSAIEAIPGKIKTIRLYCYRTH